MDVVNADIAEANICPCSRLFQRRELILRYFYFHYFTEFDAQARPQGDYAGLTAAVGF